MPGFDERLEAIFALIDGCKSRGVTKFVGDVDGHVEFTLAPAATPVDALMQALSEPPRKIDPTKCVECQVATPERGAWCRACYLKQAGVSS